MPYCIKAIISPICIVEAAMAWPPTQIMTNVTRFIIRLIAGMVKDMVRWTKRVVSRRSRFACSKRLSSYFSLPKARITINPDRFSRLTKFSRSISFCRDLNLGIAMEKITMISPISTMTAKAMIQLSETLLPTAIIIPPIPMIGA